MRILLAALVVEDYHQLQNYLLQMMLLDVLIVHLIGLTNTEMGAIGIHWTIIVFNLGTLLAQTRKHPMRPAVRVEVGSIHN